MKHLKEHKVHESPDVGIALSANFWVSCVPKTLELHEILGAPNVQNVSSLNVVGPKYVCSPLPFCVMHPSPHVSLFTSRLSGAVFGIPTYRQFIHGSSVLYFKEADMKKILADFFIFMPFFWVFLPMLRLNSATLNRPDECGDHISGQGVPTPSTERTLCVVHLLCYC